MQRIKKIENKEIQMSQSQWNYVIKEVFNDIIDEINIHIENLEYRETLRGLSLEDGAIWALLNLIEKYVIDRTTMEAYEEIDSAIDKIFEEINERLKNYHNNN